MLSFAIPGTVIGIGYIMAFNQSPFSPHRDSHHPYHLFHLPEHACRDTQRHSRLAQIDQALEEASVTLRASFATTLRRIILPLIRPAILSALVFSFVRAVTAISAVVFLVSAKWQLSTKVILDQAENGRYGLATAYSTVLIVIMAAAIALMYVVVGKTTTARRPGGRWIGVSLKLEAAPVVLKDVTKRFGKICAVDRVSLHIEPRRTGDPSWSLGMRQDNHTSDRGRPGDGHRRQSFSSGMPRSRSCRRMPAMLL